MDIKVVYNMDSKTSLSILCGLIIIAGIYLLGRTVGEAWANYDKSTKIESEK